jgi:hypothetical protein
MKTLEMLNKANVNYKTYRSENLFYSNLSGFYGAMKDYNSTFRALNCVLFIDDWKEVIKVSDDEKVILRNFKVPTWIARDSDGELCCYTDKPKKDDSFWVCKSKHSSLKFFSHLFKMVQWTDEEPTLIADLLKG